MRSAQGLKSEFEKISLDITLLFQKGNFMKQSSTLIMYSFFSHKYSTSRIIEIVGRQKYQRQISQWLWTVLYITLHNSVLDLVQKGKFKGRKSSLQKLLQTDKQFKPYKLSKKNLPCFSEANCVQAKVVRLITRIG